jgi:hypothetical protein
LAEPGIIAPRGPKGEKTLAELPATPLRFARWIGNSSGKKLHRIVTGKAQ